MRSLVATVIPPGRPTGSSAHVGLVVRSLRTVGETRVVTSDYRRPIRDTALYLARLALARGRYDLAWVRGGRDRRWAIPLARRRSGRVILDLNAVQALEMELEGKPEKAIRAYDDALRYALDASDVVRVHNEPLRDAYHRRYGVPLARLAVLPIPNDVAPAPPPPPQGPPSFVYAGSAQPWQGLPLLVDAFERVARQRPEARLSLFTAKLPQDLAARVRSPALDGRVSVGSLPHAELLARLPAFTAMVIPRPKTDITDVATPIKLTEALGAGLPVVSFDVAGVESYLRPSGGGLLVKSGDVDALADTMLRVADDRALQRALAERGHAWARDHLSLHAFGRAVEARILEAAAR